MKDLTHEVVDDAMNVSGTSISADADSSRAPVSASNASTLTAAGPSSAFYFRKSELEHGFKHAEW